MRSTPLSVRVQRLVAVDAANLIKPLLSSGKIRVIGSTTYQEFSNIFEKDRALARRFQKIDITEPSIEETVQIINGLKPKYEAHHDVRYTAKAVRAAVELAVKYINDRHLPDKAIDVIDEAGARARLMPVSKRKKTVNVADIELWWPVLHAFQRRVFLRVTAIP